MTSAYPVRGNKPAKTFEDVSFEEYVLMSKQQRKSYTSLSSSHYHTQASFLFNFRRDGRDCPITNFLGRLEHFDEDFEILLDFLNVPEMTSYFNQNGKTVTRRNAFGHNRLNKENNNEEVADKLAPIYQGKHDVIGES